MKVFLSLSVVLVLAATGTTARLVDSKVQGKFKKSNQLLVPEAVDKSKKHYIKVRFPSGVEADLGNELTPTQVKDQPCVSYLADSHCYYTLVFLGRIHGDAEHLNPSDQKQGESCKGDNVASTAGWMLPDPDICDDTDSMYREYLHWLVVNIPGSRVSGGEEFAQYISSAPMNGTGLHRYSFLVYKQPGLLHFDEKKLNNTSIKGRDKFCVSKLSDKYCLGEPIAGNYYTAQYDDYVPRVYEKLGAEYLLKTFKTL